MWVYVGKMHDMERQTAAANRKADASEAVAVKLKATLADRIYVKPLPLNSKPVYARLGTARCAEKARNPKPQTPNPTPGETPIAAPPGLPAASRRLNPNPSTLYH